MKRVNKLSVFIEKTLNFFEKILNDLSLILALFK